MPFYNLYKEEMYRTTYDYFGGDAAKISMIGGNIVMIGLFWLVGGLFLSVDITNKPKWMMYYKVQKDQNVPIDWNKLMKCIKTVAINNIFVNVLVATYPVYRAQMWRGCSFDLDDVPSWFRIILDLSVSLLIQEIIFYYSHRLLHVPWFYKHIHKKHHQWTAPIGIVAIYTHPLEYLTGNGMSVMAGPLLMGSHIITFFIWYAIANTATIIHHSGYHLPLLPSPEFHDYHHSTYNWNFGTFGFLDKWHGTDKSFRQGVELQRHRTLWSLTPIWKLYPNKPCTKDQNGTTR